MKTVPSYAYSKVVKSNISPNSGALAPSIIFDFCEVPFRSHFGNQDSLNQENLNQENCSAALSAP